MSLEWLTDEEGREMVGGLVTVYYPNNDFDDEMKEAKIRILAIEMEAPDEANGYVIIEDGLPFDRGVTGVRVQYYK